MPKYCKIYMIQGHGEDQCYVKHPELYKEKREKNAAKNATKIDKVEKGKPSEEVKNPEEGFVEPKKKGGGKQNQPPQREERVQTKNKFATVDDTNASATKGTNKKTDSDPKSNKEWVQENFNKDKVVTEKGEASNVANLSSTSKQSNGEDKKDSNVVDSGSWMLV